jgi:hypothetical protein
MGMTKKTTLDASNEKTSQVRSFRKAARQLGADESEAAFDAALGKIARHKPKIDKVDAKQIGEVVRGAGKTRTTK